MPQLDRREFLADLDAMSETRVREKLLLGHYVGWKEKVVERWLREREAQRDEERVRRNSASGERAVFCTRGRAVISAVVAAVAAVAHYLFRTGG